MSINAVLDRLEKDPRWDLGNDTDSPAIRKIKRHVRDARRADGR